VGDASFARVGVVIVTYASSADIAACLTQLPTSRLARVVVVDNDSPDDTVQVVRALNLPNVEIYEQANLGFGAGNDAGRARLPEDVEYVLFLNPDCTIDEANLAELLRFIADAPARGLVGPALGSAAGPLTPGGDLPSLLSELQPHFPRFVGRFLPRRQLNAEFSGSADVGYVEGACMLVRVDALDEVGGFDHRYFLCFEEIDLARRLRDADWSVSVCASARAQHLGQRSRAQRRLFSDYHKYRSQRLYMERWLGARRAHVYTRLAMASWRLRRMLGRLDSDEYEVLRAAVSGASFPR
jgi:N-acetylglucosaminyl-diphospho-decaprenol L-rhamnosyltransferase